MAVYIFEIFTLLDLLVMFIICLGLLGYYLFHKIDLLKTKQKYNLYDQELSLFLLSRKTRKEAIKNDQKEKVVEEALDMIAHPRQTLSFVRTSRSDDPYLLLLPQLFASLDKLRRKRIFKTSSLLNIRLQRVAAYRKHIEQLINEKFQ